MTDVLIIGSLPPYESDAAMLTRAMAEAIAAKGKEVSIVIDDHAPYPDLPTPDLPQGDAVAFGIIRCRDLLNNAPQYALSPRLFVLGAEGDSLFALELYRRIGGAVVLASNTLYPLVESACRAERNWPQAYWTWLAETLGHDLAALLFQATAYDHRSVTALDTLLPAFDFLLGKDACIIAPSPYTATVVSASHISPALTLTLLPVHRERSALEVAAAGPKPPNKKQILFVADSDTVARAVEAELASFAALKDVSVCWCHPASPDLETRITASFAVAILDRAQASCHPAISYARREGKPMITAGQPFAAHLPEGTHLAIPHSEAVHGLTLAIEALASLPDLASTLAAATLAEPITAGTETVETLLALAAEATRTPLDDQQAGHPDPEPETSQSVEPDKTLDPGIRLSHKQISLIGAAPPNQVLKQLFPHLDPSLCPRFATPDLAAQLERIGKNDAAIMLTRTGFEAPIVDGVKTWADIQPDLAFEGPAVVFSGNIEGCLPGDRLLSEAHFTAALPVCLPAAGPIQTADAAFGFIETIGLFWQEDTVRQRINCILFAGTTKPLIMRNTATEGCFLVFDGYASHTLKPGDETVVQPTPLGLLEISITAIDPEKRVPLPSSALREALVAPALELKWSVT